MKKIIILAAVLLAAPAAGARAAEAAARRKPSGEAQAKQKAAQWSRQFQTAWNDKDLDAVGALLDKQADIIALDGFLGIGYGQVMQWFKTGFETTAKDVEMTALNVRRVRALGPKNTLLDWTCEFSGVRSPEGQLLPKVKYHISLIVTGPPSQWKILAIRMAPAFAGSPG